MDMEKLALLGGAPVKTTPYGTGKRFGNEELENLKEALDQNTLFYWKGNMTKRLCEKFAKMYGVNYCVATSSGTASVHVALGAIGIEPGDEVITTPITDMGSVIGILYQNAIPVFADLDPNTYIMTPESIEKTITARTKAIIVVHLAGCAAEMDKILEIAKKRGIYVIEDCAQSYGTKYKGQYVGTFGDVGCFSLNDFKHISAGDGGMVIMNDETLFRKAHMFTDKNYNRFGAEVVKSIPLIAPNYRMNELTAAVGLAQLDKVDWICSRRHELGEKLSRGLEGVSGIYAHKVHPDCYSSYWFYMIRVDEKKLGVTRGEFTKALCAEGIIAAEGYIPSCVYQYEMFKKRCAHTTSSHFPFDGTFGEPIEYNDGDCPVAEAILKDCIKLTVNEFHTEKDIDDTIAAIKKVASYYLNNK